jgi:hypothetical protein
VIVYPDDDNKPAEGEELNRKAEITLDCVWPTDKSTRSYIKVSQLQLFSALQSIFAALQMRISNVILILVYCSVGSGEVKNSGLP